jgi:hypothetical protein
MQLLAPLPSLSPSPLLPPSPPSQLLLLLLRKVGALPRLRLLALPVWPQLMLMPRCALRRATHVCLLPVRAQSVAALALQQLLVPRQLLMSALLAFAASLVE